MVNVSCVFLPLPPLPCLGVVILFIPLQVGFEMICVSYFDIEC